MKRAAIQLLGRFSVTVDGALISGDTWRSRRAADVLKLLALSPDRRLHRSQVMEALWPESDPQASGTNLRKALHFARRATGDEQTIVSQQGVLVLWPDAHVDTDVERFEAAARAALAAGDPEGCRAATDLYSGDLLPDDRYESWLAEPHRRLRQRYLDLLRAGALWERLSDEDPTDEQAARALISTLGNAERRSDVSNGSARRSTTSLAWGRTARRSPSTKTFSPLKVHPSPPRPNVPTHCSPGPWCT